MENNTDKRPMSDEERLNLAAKLDKELDDYINSLPKRPYVDGWPQDKWEEEFERHPFFMKEPPKPGDKLHPLMEGLQQLKYDADQNSPEELAQSYKDDGNFNFKHRNYRLAVLSYTEGIKAQCTNLDLHATLYYNRATAQFYLKNYRSALHDCESALKYKPKYEKAFMRAINCCLLTNSFESAIQFCHSMLELYPENKDAQELLTKANNGLRVKLRDNRKQMQSERKEEARNNRILEVITKRGYTIEGQTDEDRIRNLRPAVTHLHNHQVFLDEEDHLVWPVAFSYPEYQITEYIEEFSEDDMFLDHLHRMFDEPAVWDTNKKYKPDSINVYYENMNDKKLYKVQLESRLSTVLKRKGFVINWGMPTFFILPRCSKAEKFYTSK